jgi:DNA-binding transcriptional LysR family regulator
MSMQLWIAMFNTDWDELKLFLQVARAQSFSAAADNGSPSQSTMSRRIQNLERELGVELFHRTVQGIMLTPTAEAILQLVTEMESRVKLIEARAAQEKALSGNIRLAVSDGIGGYWLPPRMKEFHRRYPSITVEIICSPSMPEPGAKGTDIALSWHQPEDPDAVILSENKMILRPVASIEYLKTYGVPKSLDDLKHHRLCDHLHYPKNEEWKAWANIVEESKNVSYRTNSSWALGEATKNGVGISLQPIGVLNREPNLRLVELNGYSTSLRFWLSCHKKIKDIPRIRALIDYIKSEIFLRPVQGSAFYSDT